MIKHHSFPALQANTASQACPRLRVWVIVESIVYPLHYFIVEFDIRNAWKAEEHENRHRRTTWCLTSMAKTQFKVCVSTCFGVVSAFYLRTKQLTLYILLHYCLSNHESSQDWCTMDLNEVPLGSITRIIRVPFSYKEGYVFIDSELKSGLWIHSWLSMASVIPIG